MESEWEWKRIPGIWICRIKAFNGTVGFSFLSLRNHLFITIARRYWMKKLLSFLHIFFLPLKCRNTESRKYQSKLSVSFSSLYLIPFCYASSFILTHSYLNPKRIWFSFVCLLLRCQRANEQNSGQRFAVAFYMSLYCYICM